MTKTMDRSEVKQVADRDETVEGVVADRTGLEKPVTFSGTANPNDRFCELCTYAASAGFIAPKFRDGTAVCTTHARALVTGEWDVGVKYEVVPLEEA